MDIAASSTEYLHVTVTATTPDGAPATLTTPPRIAVLAHNGSPEEDDWHTGAWSDGAARLLVGPEGGALELSPGPYWVWAAWVAGLEAPVYRSGRIRVY